MKFLHSPSSTSSSSTSSYTTGCFPGLLRRLLCSHTLPSLPFTESYANNDLFYANKLHGNPPGIVAKLMGLDSMPTKPPSFVQLENDKFIILSFEGGGKDKELGLKKTRNWGPEPENDGINSCNVCARSRKKKHETESDSENSSPVSVLEFPGKEDSNSNLRRKLIEKNSPSPSSSSRSSCNLIDESSRNRKKCVGLKKKNFVIEDFGEEICKMAERDVMDSSRERWKGEDFREIGVSFELQILDQLIIEVFTNFDL